MPFDRQIKNRVPILSHNEIRDIPTNFYLEKSSGFISTIIPIYSENYINNPSIFDVFQNMQADPWANAIISDAIDNYNKSGGPYGGGLFSYNNVTGGVLSYNQLQPANTYAPSVAIMGQGTVIFRITDGINTLSEATYELTSNWVQYENPIYTIGVDTTLSFQIIPVGNLQSMQVGFLQNEVNVNNEATTFFDGNFSGDLFESADVYRWNGPANQSTSIRTANTISGGKVVNLKELGFLLTSIGNIDIPDEQEIITSPFALRKGSLLRCKTISERTITIEGQIFGCNLKELICRKDSIGRAIFTEASQRVFIYQPIVNCIPCEPVKFTACLSAGYEGEYNSLYGQEVEIDLLSVNPYFNLCTAHSEELNLFTSSDFNTLIAIDNSGNPQNIFDTTIYPTAPVIPPSNTESALVDYEFSEYNGFLYYAIQTANTVTDIYCFDGTTHTQIAQTTTPGFVIGLVSVIKTCGRRLYIGGSFELLTGMNGFVGVSGNAIAQIDLIDQQVNNLGDVTNGGIPGNITAIDCISNTTGDFLILGNFDSALPNNGPTINASGYSHALGLFRTNDFPINIGGGFNGVESWFENGGRRTLIYGNFQNNNNPTFNNIDATLPESISYFNGTTRLRTDFVFDIAGVGFPVANITSAIRLSNGTIFIGGDFGKVITDVPHWNGSLGNTVKGFAVLDLNLVQGAPTDITGRILPINGEINIDGWGAGNDFTSLEKVRSMALLPDGRVIVVGTLTEVGQIDTLNTVDQGIIEPRTEVCGGFIWNPNQNDARFGTVEELDIDLNSLDFDGNSCRVLKVKSFPPNAPGVLDISHIYQVNANDANEVNIQTAGVTDVVLCDDQLFDQPFEIEIQGEAELRNIQIGVNTIFENNNEPITIADGETFRLNYRTLPPQFELSFGDEINLRNFQQGELNSPTTSISLNFTQNSLGANAYAKVIYFPHSLISSNLLCSDCIN